MLNFITKIFGSRNDRLIKRLQKTVNRINELEANFEAMSDAELQAQTDAFRKRLNDGEKLDNILPEAFAVVREAGKRVLNMRHFDVQLIGGMVLHQGKISEMKTGEGKTLVATLPAYLNALSGEGVHIVTVNDYLAKRDSEWMGRLYEFLGMTTGVIVGDMDHAQRKAAYAADITYGTNNEFGFDYLRDNMAFTLEDRVQGRLNFAVVDEVDSILIDEARTPLIISGPTEDSSDLYRKIDKLIPLLVLQEQEDGPGDYSVDEKGRQVHLTEDGHQHLEELLVQNGLLEEGDSLYSSANLTLMHHANAALRAHSLFTRNVDYVVKDDQIVIVDEFTGRTMPGRRWSDGLHQAVEAKENVRIQQENQTLASITFQNYFRLYNKLSGMTGTADTEAFEFHQIYSLEVVVIPTHRAMVRDDRGDLVFLNMAQKYKAIIEDIQDCRERGQPVLVGTASIESSEHLAEALKASSIKDFEVLNAKFHAREAEIIVQAGRPGAVTIATNMAGRGTDIVLGGNVEAEINQLKDPTEAKISEMRAAWQLRHDQVIDAGGLHIIGTERHESRRIDNQLRGRAGRQGDPGSSRFYLSLEDNLLRIFARDRMGGIMQKLWTDEEEALEHPMVTRAIENAQRKVEGHNFDIRKQLLEYDDVANDQRKVIYEQRNELLEVDSVEETIHIVRHDILNELINMYIPPGSPDEMWNVEGLEQALKQDFLLELPIAQWLEEDDHLYEETLREKIEESARTAYSRQESKLGPELLRQFEKNLMLQVLDQQWKDHLAAMDYLRQGIHLRGYAQKNPKQEYKREAFEMFSMMLDTYKRDVCQIITREMSRAEEQIEADIREMEARRQEQAPMEFQHADASAMSMAQEAAVSEENGETALAAKPYVREQRKVGRNEPCPCGSGKKFKQCHGKLA